MIYKIYYIVHNIYVVFLDLCKLVFTYSSIPVAFFFMLWYQNHLLLPMGGYRSEFVANDW